MSGKKLLAIALTAAMFLSAGSGAFAASSETDDDVKSSQTTVVKGSDVGPRVFGEGDSSGSCGDAMTWSYDDKTSVLTISGSGTMSSHPWSGSFKSSIVTVVFSGNITSICDSAFYDCTNLGSIVIPDSVTNIGYSAFKGCKNLDSVTFGKNSNLNTLGKNYSNDGVFQNCVNLSEITLPNKLTAIQRDTFSGCTNLEKITIGSGVKSIGAYAFNNCGNLTSVVIPNSVESLGDNIFRNCTNLASVKLGSSLLSIGYSAFEGCSSLTSIVIPASVTSIDYSAFKNLKNLSSVVFGSGSNLTTLGRNYSNDGVFQGCTSIKSITLPDNLTAIQRDTFNGCSSLEKVKIGSGVKSVGDYAFYNCVNLASVTIPDNVESLGGGSFKNCSNLKSVKLGGSLLKIGYSSFEGCSNLTEITIPASVTDIDYSAFKNLKNLTGVVFAQNSNLTNLGKNYSGDGVFQGCTGITSIVLPDKLTAVCRDTFNGCTSLEKVTVGKHVVTINSYAFTGCIALKEIILPKALTTIENYAFKNCSALNTVKFTGSQTRWNNLKNDGINATGNEYLLNALKYVYDYADEMPTVSVTASPSTSLNAGDSVTFKATASGTGLTYQWYYKKSGQTAWSAWNGRTTASTTATANTSWNGMQVKCIVKNSAGNSVSSNILTLKVTEKAAITTQPASVVVVADGATAKFSVKATGTGTLKYQWYYKKSGQTAWNAWNNKTTASTSAVANSTWDGMQVRCVVKDSNSSVTSSASTVYIKKALTITSHPVSVTTSDGKTVSFTVKATGTGVLKYQWYYKKSGGSWTKWNGHTTATTTATANSTWNGMKVYCIVTDSAGSTAVSNSAAITVKKAPVITQQPANVTVYSGKNVSFTVKATGTGTLKYQWYIKKSGQTSWTLWNNHTTATTTATSNDTWNKMQVRCVVTDSNGSTTSSAATVTIAAQLKITANSQNVVVSAGKNTTFTVKATGTGLKYQWYFKKAGGSWTLWNGRTTASTTATANSSWDEMQVRCLVTDATGNKVYSGIATVYVM